MTVCFSQTFPLRRNILSKALCEFYKNPKMNKDKQILAIGRGIQEVEAYTRWLSIMGLRDSKKRELTVLGKIITEADPRLIDDGTKWIMHYQLCSDSSSKGAEVWFYFINSFLPEHSTFSRADLKRTLEIDSGIITTNKRGIAVDSSLVIDCYTSEEALGGLKIIQSIDERNQSYRSVFTSNISPLIVAYALFNQRLQDYPEATSISINEALSKKGNIGRIFVLTNRKLTDILAILQAKGYINILTYADLNHIQFLFNGNPLEILRDYYQGQRTHNAAT